MDRRVDRRGDLTALDELESRRVAVPRRRRIEDPPAADCRRVAENDAVSSGSDNGCRQAELGPVLPDSMDTRRSPCRPVVDGQGSAVGNRHDLFKGDVEAVRDRERARRHKCVATAELPSLDSR